MTKKQNGQGSVRQLPDGSFECVIQSKYLNPETNKYKRFKRKGKTEKEAIKNSRMALLAWEKSYESGLNMQIDKKKTFGEYMKDFIEKEVKPNVTGSTYKSYIYTLDANFYNHRISSFRLNTLNTVEFEVYFDALSHEKSIKTASVPIQLCKRCSTWLYGKSLIEEDYAKFVRTKKQVRDEFFRKDEKDKTERKEYFTNKDIIKFYESYKNNISEYCPAIILILETMMRGQELLALTLDDIDFENNTITIKSAVSERFIDGDKEKGLEKYIKVPKTGKQRTIYMTPLAKEVIEYLMAQTKLKCRENPNNLLFPSYLKHGKMRSMDAFEIQFKDLCNKIGVDRDVRSTKLPNNKIINKGLSVHALRHTAITIANTAPNANIVNTALMAGHTAIRTENIYTHPNINAMKNIKTAGTLLGKNNNTSNNITDNELYDMYLKLKEKFESKL